GIWTMADPWTTAKTPVRAPLAVGVKVPPPYSFRRQANATRRLLPKVAPVRSPLVNPKRLTKLAVGVPILVTVTIWGLLASQQAKLRPPVLRRPANGAPERAP